MWKRNAVLFAILWLPTQAFAWGAEGHHIVAAIAADGLTPAARRQVEELLGGDASMGMMEASTWADELRMKRPRTASWHFVDVPIGSAGYNPQRDCRSDDCVVAQIERDARIIADHQLSLPVRAEALRFLIHFVGDVHQPLHAADNHDRGGNEIHVTSRRQKTTLHSVWDVDVVRALGRSPEQVAATLEREMSASTTQQWERGTARDWANESFQLASKEIYSHISGGDVAAPVILPSDYARDESHIAAEQLKKAGVRLAWVLNQSLR
jgi:nuclease S1